MVVMPRAVILELKRLAVLSASAVFDLASDWCPELLATDASNFGIGVSAAPVPPPLLRELWRHRERRGAYVHLHSQWQCRLRLDELGGEDPQALEADLWGTAPSPERVLIECFDFVELCCGPRAPLLSAHAAAGLRVGPRIDLAVHPFWNLAECRIVEWLLFSHDAFAFGPVYQRSGRGRRRGP